MKAIESPTDEEYRTVKGLSVTLQFKKFFYLLQILYSSIYFSLGV